MVWRWEILDVYALTGCEDPITKIFGILAAGGVPDFIQII
jgi:hypothetical protein